MTSAANRPFIEIAEADADPATAERLSTLISELFSGRGLVVSTREGRNGVWRIEVILPPGEAWAEIEPLLAETSPAPLPRFTPRRLDRDAWAAAPQPELAPVRAGRFFVHDSRHRPAAGGVSIEIEAGLAFGTGHHATTAGCLTALDRLLKLRRFKNSLDLGCGTAILAIAAAKAARARVAATDIDPVAIGVARKNAARNAVLPLVAFRRADGPRDPVIAARAPFDLVMANILAGPLERFAQALAALTQPGGTVILSGLLTGQAARLAARYRAAGFVLQDRLVIREWATLTFALPGSRQVKKKERLPIRLKRESAPGGREEIEA
jgi:ribosomal protein L11 methyltransferase